MHPSFGFRDLIEGGGKVGGFTGMNVSARLRDKTPRSALLRKYFSQGRQDANGSTTETEHGVAS